MKQLIKGKMDKTIIARNEEIDSIKKHFDRVLEGDTEVAFIKGQPGVGKTFFVEHVVKELASKNVTYVYGKYVQSNERPFTAISEIIEQMTKHVLTLPYEQLKKIKNTLIKSLGADIEIITTISPYSIKLFQKYKPINIDNYDKLKYRIKKTIYQFLSTVSEALFPLVIFIDDLQWADRPSFEIIEIICKDNELFNLMLILAYRDNEEECVTKVEALLKIQNIQKASLLIELHPLTEQHIKDYIYLVFGEETQDPDYLVRIIYGLTLGNPFYIKGVIDIFIKEDILSYSPNKNKWVVNFENMNKLTLPRDMEQMMWSKITMLSSDEKALLEYIACFDGKVTYAQIERLIHSDEISLKSKLNRLCEIALIVPRSNDNLQNEIVSYHFIHDIPLELVYKNIDIKKRENIHYKIAKSILCTDDKFIENSRLFMASQLLRSDYKECMEDCPKLWINNLYDAGIEAKKTTAMEQALKIFELCTLLLPYGDFKENNNLEMKINLELAECKFLCEDFKHASEIFEMLIKKYNTCENLVIIKRRYMNLYSYKGECEKAIQLGMEVLSHLDFSFDMENFNSELLKVESLFSLEKIEELTNAPMIQDKKILTILETLNQMIPAANYVDNKVFTLILIKIGILSAEHGRSVFTSMGYVACSFIFCHIWKDYKKGEKLANITLELLSDTDDHAIKTIVYSFMGTFVEHWYNPLESSIQFLDTSIEEGIKSGELVYSSYAIISGIYAKYLIGRPFEEIICDTNIKVKELQKVGYHSLKFIDYFFNSHLQYLQKGILPKEDEEINAIIKNYDNAESIIYYILKLQRLYLEGKIEKAYSIVGKIKPYISLLKGHIVYMEIMFYFILVQLEQHNILEDFLKDKNKTDIENDLNELKEAVDYYNGNHYIRYLLAEGTYEAVFEEGKFTTNHYNEAISLSEKNGNLYLEAVGNVLAATYYQNHKKLSQFYAKEAVECYEKWGAMYIAKLTEKEFEILVTQQSQVKQKNIMVTSDILNHINHIEGMSEKEGFTYILDFLVKQSGADYGAILFEKCNEMHVAYKNEREGQVYAYPDLVDIKYISNMSRKIIRYVARTGEEVFLKEKPDSGIYSKDIYIMDKEYISIICVPMHYMGIFIGSIYLESVCKDGLNESIISVIKGVIPSLMLKQTRIKNVNLQNLFNPKMGTSSLTDRELEVLELVAEGLSNIEISKQLFVSQGTVKSHLNNIYSKLEVDSRIKAVVKAKEMNIIK